MDFETGASRRYEEDPHKAKPPETRARKELPQYQSHKKVWALKIAELQFLVDTGSLWIKPAEEGYSAFHVPAKFVPKHDAARPEVGWYWVRYEGGYESFSPPQPFEDGYTRI